MVRHCHRRHGAALAWTYRTKLVVAGNAAEACAAREGVLLHGDDEPVERGLLAQAGVRERPRHIAVPRAALQSIGRVGRHQLEAADGRRARGLGGALRGRACRARCVRLVRERRAGRPRLGLERPARRTPRRRPPVELLACKQGRAFNARQSSTQGRAARLELGQS